MLPHKLHRGKQALNNLKVFDGVPPPYDKRKRMVVPSALRVIRLKPRRRFCVLNRLSHEVGWKYQGVISTLENRRKVRSSLFYKKKLQEKVGKSFGRFFISINSNSRFCDDEYLMNKDEIIFYMHHHLMTSNFFNNDFL